MTRFFYPFAKRPRFIAYSDDFAKGPVRADLRVVHQDMIRAAWKDFDCLSFVQSDVVSAMLKVHEEKAKEKNTQWCLPKHEVATWAKTVAIRIRTMLKHVVAASAAPTQPPWFNQLKLEPKPAASAEGDEDQRGEPEQEGDEGEGEEKDNENEEEEEPEAEEEKEEEQTKDLKSKKAKDVTSNKAKDKVSCAKPDEAMKQQGGMKKPFAAESTSEQFFYGFNKRLGKSWRAPCDRPKAKELSTEIFAAPEAKPTDQAKARFEDGTLWDIDSYTCEDFLANSAEIKTNQKTKGRKPAVEALWEGTCKAGNLKLAWRMDRPPLVSLYLQSGSAKMKQICQIKPSCMSTNSVDEKDRDKDAVDKLCIEIMTKVGKALAAGTVEALWKARESSPFATPWPPRLAW